MNKDRTSWSIYNNGAAQVFIGNNPDVSTTNGYPIDANSALGFNEGLGDDPTMQVLGIAAASRDIRVIENVKARKVLK